MNIAAAYLLLFLAAVLKLAATPCPHRPPPWLRRRYTHRTLCSRRVSFICLWSNSELTGMEFRKLLGVYVTLFFLVAQVINLIFYGARPDLPVLIGGALIVSGGLVITFWRT